MSNFSERYGLGSVLHKNKIIAYGGVIAGPLVSGECYKKVVHDIVSSTDSWVLTKTSNSGNPGRLYHPSICSLINSTTKLGVLWLFGGFTGASYSNKICSSTDLGATWTTVTTFASNREVKTCNFKGIIHICGGNVAGTAIKEHKTWDGTTLSALSDMPIEMKDHALVYHKGSLYAIGGRDVVGSALPETYYYNTAEGWQPFYLLHNAVYNAMACSFKGKIWVYGGITEGAETLNIVQTLSDSVRWVDETRYVTMQGLDGITIPFPYLSDASILSTGLHMFLSGGIDNNGVLQNKNYFTEDGYHWVEINTLKNHNLYTPLVYNIRNLGTNEANGYQNEPIQLQGVNLRTYIAEDIKYNLARNGAFITNNDIPTLPDNWTLVITGGSTGTLTFTSGAVQGGVVINTTTNPTSDPTTLLLQSDPCRAGGERNYRIFVELSDITPPGQPVDLHLYTGGSPASYIKETITTNATGDKQWYFSDIMEVATTETDIRVGVGLAGLAGSSLTVNRVVLVEV